MRFKGIQLYALLFIAAFGLLCVVSLVVKALRDTKDLGITFLAAMSLQIRFFFDWSRTKWTNL